MLSLNDHALADPAHEARADRSGPIAERRACCFANTAITCPGINMNSNVYVIEKSLTFRPGLPRLPRARCIWGTPIPRCWPMTWQRTDER